MSFLQLSKGMRVRLGGDSAIDMNDSVNWTVLALQWISLQKIFMLKMMTEILKSQKEILQNSLQKLREAC